MRPVTSIHRRGMTSESCKPGSTRVGWIGTGVMGQSMVSHLIKADYQTTVFSRTLSKCEPLRDLGATVVDSPKKVAENSDVVFLIVGYPEDVESCILGDNGVLNGSSQGNVIVDMTTSNPALANRIHEIGQERGIHCIDAPVSGGDLGAKNAALTIMVGGDTEPVEFVKPLFNLMGKTVEHMGKPGSGQHTKMANQIMIATTMIGLIEGMLYAQKAGLNVDQVIQAVRGGAAGSRSLELYAERILQRDFEPGFYVDHFVKDLGICLSESERMGLDLPGLILAKQLYEKLQANGYGLKGTQSLMMVLEEMNA